MNTKVNETEYLISSEVNKLALDESIQQLEEGKGIKILFEDLFIQ